jgi:hypothetical protein
VTGETHFVLGQHWKAHFEQAQAREGGPLTVARLRQWLDQPQAMGLPTEAANLVVLVFAGQTNRSFFLNQGPFQPSLDNLPGTLELREQSLPSPEDWDLAVARAGALFGLTVAQTRNAANCARLVEAVLDKAREAKGPLSSLVGSLQQRLTAYGAAEGAADGTDGSVPPRLTTARSAQALLAAVVAAEPDQVVGVLAQSPIATSETAMAQTLARAKVLDETLRMAGWDIFAAVTALSDHRRQAALGIRTRIAEVLAADEHAIALKPALDEQQAKALRLLTDVPKAPSEPPKPPPIDLPEAVLETVVVREAKAVNLQSGQAFAMLKDIRREIEMDPTLRLSVTWRLTR